MILEGEVVFLPKIGLDAILRRDQCVVWDSRWLPDGSFGALGGRGADNWLLLGPNEINHILSVGDNLALKNWSMSDMGDIYTNRDDLHMTVRWPVILLTSTFAYVQHVRILRTGISLFNGKAREAALVDGIPYQSNGDYSAYTSAKHPEFWLYAFTDYVSDPPTYGPSHNGMTFRMPIWASDTFPASLRSASNKSIGGNWVDARCFA